MNEDIQREPARPLGPFLGVDVGQVRVGVAISDPEGRFATPLVTLRRGRSDLTELVRIIAERGVTAVVIGLPLSLSGAKGKSALATEEYAGKLAKRVARHGGQVSVHLVDERLTTVVAARKLTGRGVSAKSQRSIVDQVAAAEILQTWLDSRRQ